MNNVENIVFYDVCAEVVFFLAIMQDGDVFIQSNRECC